jgi:hypothetical protein
MAPAKIRYCVCIGSPLFGGPLGPGRLIVPCVAPWWPPTRRLGDPGCHSTPVALAFTGITPQEFTFILWFRIALCPYVCQDSLIGKERMSQPVGVIK